ncbi:MAG TPA: hypothetical protein VE980_13610 [Pyrinomonadaceae bacterium]|nr:hypothetical protein [Pyrinomonadaceae bacterium]
MRKLLFALGLTSALVFALAAHAAAPNFAGNWTLDKSKSQGLNPRLQNAESVTWNVTQTEKEITIDEKVAGGGGPGGPPPGGAPAAGAPAAGGPPPGGGQGGGRGMGGGMGGGPRTFNLDGSETTGDMGRGKFVRKATLSSDGKTLELVSKVTFQTQDGNEVTTTSTDKLSLSADGKSLTVVRHSESPRGAQDSTLVFNK